MMTKFHFEQHIPLIVIPNYALKSKYLGREPSIPVIYMDELETYTIGKNRLLILWMNNPRLESIIIRKLCKKFQHPLLKISRSTLPLSDYMKHETKTNLMEYIDDLPFYSDTVKALHKMNQKLVFVSDRHKVIYFETPQSWREVDIRHAKVELPDFPLFDDWLESEVKFAVRSFRNEMNHEVNKIPDFGACKGYFMDYTGTLILLQDSDDNQFEQRIMNSKQMSKYGYVTLKQVKRAASKPEQYKYWLKLIRKLHEEGEELWFHSVSPKAVMKPYSKVWGCKMLRPSGDSKAIMRQVRIKAIKDKTWILPEHLV